MCVAAGHRAEQCVCKCLAHVCFTCIAHQFTYIEKNEGMSMKGCRLLSAADPGLEGLQRRPGGRVGGWLRQHGSGTLFDFLSLQARTYIHIESLLRAHGVSNVI